jgi:23S rRNA (uracil1939-C5)-methyltransferase
VSAGAFFQANRFLADELAGLVTGGRRGALALDLYAGVGLFTVALAAGFERVVAVESAPVSWADLRRNVPPNVKTARSTVEEYLGRKDAPRPDLIVLDPPRSGLGRGVARALAALDAPRITYVACDPATLSRDLRPLLESGYRVDEAHLVDLFPQTFHIESVLHLNR